MLLPCSQTPGCSPGNHYSDSQRAGTINNEWTHKCTFFLKSKTQTLHFKWTSVSPFNRTSLTEKKEGLGSGLCFMCSTMAHNGESLFWVIFEGGLVVSDVQGAEHQHIHMKALFKKAFSELKDSHLSGAAVRGRHVCQPTVSTSERHKENVWRKTWGTWIQNMCWGKTTPPQPH